MRKYVEHLHKKPEHIRRRILYATVPTLTLVVVMFWFASLTPDAPTRARTAVVLIEEVAPSAIVREDSSTLWTGIRAEIADFFSRERVADTAAASEALPVEEGPGFFEKLRAGMSSFIEGAKSAL